MKYPILISFIASSLFGAENLSAQRLSKYINLYGNCDSAVFSVVRYTKTSIHRKNYRNKEYYTFKRQLKGFDWFCFSISKYDSISWLSHFDPITRSIWVYDTNGMLQKYPGYTFYNKYDSPPFLWEPIYYLTDRYVYNEAYLGKRYREGDFMVFEKKRNYRYIRLYADLKTGLITRMVRGDTSSVDSLLYQYSYFKSGNFLYENSQPDSAFFPVSPANARIVSEIRNRELNKPRKIVADIQEIKSTLLNDTTDFYLIDFWYAACLPCIINLRYLDTAVKGIPRLTTVLVNGHEDQQDMEAFIKKRGIGFRSIADTTRKFQNYFQIQAYPTSILMNRKGEVIFRYEGKLEPHMQSIKDYISEH